MKKKMRLLYITHEYGAYKAGGIGQVINGIAAFISESHMLDIFLLKPGLAGLGWDVEFYMTGNNRHKRKFYRFLYLNALKCILAANNYQIVHTMHCGGIIKNCINVIKEQFPGMKIIYSCHSLIKHEIHIRKNNPRESVTEENILNKIDHIHLLNKTSWNYFEKTYPQLAMKLPVSIIPNGVDENEYKEINKRWISAFRKRVCSKDIIVLCMSRWSHGKGLEYLLDAIPLVIRNVNNIKFIIAGRKKRRWEYKQDTYLRIIDGKIQNLKSHLITYSWLNDVERNALFSTGDIWVMPSQLEYFPYSIIEPMVCRLPIISARIDCVMELLEENTECLFYAPESPDELAEKIILLISEKERRKMLAENAYKKATNNFSWKLIAGMYANMYQTVNDRRVYYE